MSRDDDAAPAEFLTLVMPLTARSGMTNAHVRLPARFPGITQHLAARGVVRGRGADIIRCLGADSQLDDEVSSLFLPTPAHVLI